MVVMAETLMVLVVGEAAAATTPVMVVVYTPY
jgi:hypothetical protein